MSEYKRCSGHSQMLPLENFSQGQLHRRGALCLECLRKKNHQPKDKWFSVRTFAKYRKLSFELTLEQFTDIVSQPCIYSNGKENSQIYIGVDRIDNLQGYTLENCVPCCYKHNLIKGKWFSHEDMSKLVALFSSATECGNRPCKM
jgi:hypothetical protein